MDNNILDLNDLKRIELEILTEIDAYCNANNIEYFLDSGTLLGAVRHKGFIPWDDDIDILMPRKDYEVFKSKFNKENKRYKILSYDISNGYYYSFAKVVDTSTTLVEDIGRSPIPDYGVYVDIFPLDGLPDNTLKKKILREKLWLLRAMWDDSLLNKPRSKKIIKLMRFKVSHLIGWKRLCKMIDDSIKIIDCKKVEYCGNIIATSKKNRQVKSEVFKTYTLIEFEGKKFRVPIGYREYLTELYGEYMSLPPKEQQVSNHIFQAFKK